MKERSTRRDLVSQYKLPLKLEKMSRWGAPIKKNGGSVSVLGPNSVPHASYDFKASETRAGRGGRNGSGRELLSAKTWLHISKLVRQ
jgi:hypothetical protein